MTTCETCKYWEQAKSYSSAKRCRKIELLWLSQEWDKTTGKLKFKENTPLAFVQDGSDYYAELVTKPNFGCNQWERKDDNLD